MNNSISNHICVNRGAQTSPIYFSQNSGRIIYRDKIDTIIGIKHPGIILGNDMWETSWVIHNHYGIGFPQIVTYQEFSMGNRVFYDNRQVFYNNLQIIERAIAHWFEKREYSWLTNNCQQFVNEVTQNSKYSESIDGVCNNAMLAGGLVSLVGLLTGNKAALSAGLSLTGVAAAGKTLSRLS